MALICAVYCVKVCDDGRNCRSNRGRTKVAGASGCEICPRAGVTCTGIRYDDNGGDPGSQLGLPSSQGTTEIGFKLLLPGANFREGY